MFTIALSVFLKSYGSVGLFVQRAGRAFVACALTTVVAAAVAPVGGLAGGPPAGVGAEMAASPAAQPFANALTVTSTDDSGAGSLRQAIADAAQEDVITFNLPPNSKITLTSGELVIDKHLSINGPGADMLAVSGNNAQRVFRVTSGVAVSISGLTIRDGGIGGFNISGGGIDNAGTLTLRNCAVSNNNAFGGSGTVGGSGSGGAINNQSSGTMTLTNCAVSNNSAKGGSSGHGASGGAIGGGINNLGTLALISSVVSNNTAAGRGDVDDGTGPVIGGGIDNSGSLTLVDSEVSSNSATGGEGRGSNAQGGGINNRPSGTLTLSNSTIKNNSAIGGSFGFGTANSASGGGINSLGTLTLINSTISNNTATAGSNTGGNGGLADGGGINSVGTLTLTNSTISNNFAKGSDGDRFGLGGPASGGGIKSQGTLTLTNCTVTLNSVLSGKGKTSNALGGGIFFGQGDTAKPLNTIVAGNSVATVSVSDDSTVSGTDVFGTFATQGHNLVGKNDGAETSFPAGNPNGSLDIVGTPATPFDAHLGPLADNGGTTQTHRPLLGSPAIDSGSASVLGQPLSLQTDQRGPGFPRIVGTAVDIGAVEVSSLSNNTIQFTADNFTVNEGVGSIQITITRTGGVDAGDITVDYETSDGTAFSRSDYAAAFGTLRFDAGEATKSINVFVTNDTFVEGNETVILRLSNPTGDATLGPLSTSTLTIKDNDTAPPVANPIEDAQFFVRQHYIDFLGREPDAAGLDFWANQITSCGSNTPCRDARRVHVSASFFLSIEFQQTGFFAIRVQRAAFGKRSSEAASRVTFTELLRDAHQLGEGVVVGPGNWEQRLEQNKQTYLSRIVNSDDYKALFPAAQTAAQYVDALFSSAGISPTSSERQSAINAFGAGGAQGRAAALRSVAESASLTQAESNPAFVLSEYFGYLRRNPNDAPDSNDDGYQFWLGKLNQFGGDFVKAEMVKAFITSGEYRQRFGPQ